VPAVIATTDTEDVSREVAMLDSARASLAASDFDATIQQLNHYDLTYPHGHLRSESLAVRIQVYERKQDDAHARELSEQFLREYPVHPFAARARALLDQPARR
jgi:outer membrane protein assembly factor BamD (BamD/ComL family)